jgi:phosphoglycolate phosphatase
MNTLLVDLDGTVTEPGRGIIGAFRHAVAAMTGREAPPHGELGWVIGPPLRISLPRVLPPGADVEAALGHYRAFYDAGAMFDAVVHEGVPEALAGLAAEGWRIILCTSKPHVFARRILDHFGLIGHFEAIHGAEFDGTRDNKGDLIGHILTTERVEAGRAVMIGDREHDVLGARRWGIPAIGVLWGYGGREELDAAGAARIIAAPSDIPGAARGLLA